ncbi:MAG: prephenate dehydratase [Chloroflexi bacterium]|nr:prephenate dehydratase [Chloroflexota bacterium]
MRLAYLGPAGTYSEEAALKYAPGAELVPFPSVAAVGSAVSSGMVDEGVVAIENSLEGSVNDTLDLLIHESGIFIRKELILPIEHCILAKPGVRVQDVRVIFSHPQAFAQSRRFIERCFPKAQLVAAFSTAGAVEEMLAHDGDAVAIASKRAAELYGAQILARNIQDRSPNVTRFVVLADSDHAPTGNDKTSLCFTFAEDKPGQLFSVLKEFAERNINLVKIESRPLREGLGKYFFLADLEGHREDPIIAETIDRIKAFTSSLKIFGSYPRYQNDA